MIHWSDSFRWPNFNEKSGLCNIWQIIDLFRNHTKKSSQSRLAETDLSWALDTLDSAWKQAHATRIWNICKYILFSELRALHENQKLLFMTNKYMCEYVTKSRLPCGTRGEISVSDNGGPYDKAIDICKHNGRINHVIYCTWSKKQLSNVNNLLILLQKSFLCMQ